MLEKAITMMESTNVFISVHPLLSRALSLHEKAYGKEHHQTQGVLTTTAGFYMQHDKVVQAEFALQRLATCLDRRPRGGREEEYTIALSLCVLQTVLGDHEQAIELAVQAAEAVGTTKAGESSSQQCAMASLAKLRLGHAFAQTGKQKRALRVLEDALAAAEEAQDPLLVAYCLVEFAQALDTTDTVQCRSLLKRVVDISAGQTSLQLPRAMALASLGALSSADADAAIEDSLAALSIYRNSLEISTSSASSTSPSLSSSENLLPLPSTLDISMSIAPSSSTTSLLAILLSSPTLYPSLSPSLLVAAPDNASPATSPIFSINSKRPVSASRPGSGWGRRTLTPRGGPDFGRTGSDFSHTSTATQDADSSSFSSVWYRLACHLHYNLGHQYAQAGHPKALKHLNKAMSMLRSLSPPHPSKAVLFQSLESAIAPLSLEQPPRKFNHIPSPPPSDRPSTRFPLHRDCSKSASTSYSNLFDEDEDEEVAEGDAAGFSGPLERLRNRRKGQRGK
jgi:tetratricopeptide (TPR) repeat protein